MELKLATSLICNGILQNGSPQVWADLGAGSGLFSNALVNVFPKGSEVFAIDKSAQAFKEVKFDKAIRTLRADFENEPLNLKELDGILMANSLHFVPDKPRLFKKLLTFLKPGGRLVIEYDLERANPWVPFPVSFSKLQGLVHETAIGAIEKLREVPSSYNRANIYSALVTLNREAGF